MKTLIAIIIIVVLGLFFVRTYTSSPGYVPLEMAREFNRTAKKCYGASFLLNAEEVATDSPGYSLCIGILK